MKLKLIHDYYGIPAGTVVEIDNIMRLKPGWSASGVMLRIISHGRPFWLDASWFAKDPEDMKNGRSLGTRLTKQSRKP